MDRINRLPGPKAVPASERDRIVGQQAEAQAALQVAQKELEVAKLNLAYTKIPAPIAGKISQPELDPGNMVVAGNTRLATIVSQGPVYVDFGVYAPTVSRLRRTGSGQTGAAPAIPVLVGGLGPDNDFPHRRQIESIDPEVNPNGTVRCRALLPNADGTLLPGACARVRPITGAPYKALLVPERAKWVSGQGRGSVPAVLVVNDHNIVETRAVKLGRNVDDGLVVVTEGLTAQDWVVSPARPVCDGMTVQPQKAAGPASLQPPHR